MNVPKLESIAEKEAKLWNLGLLVDFAYYGNRAFEGAEPFVLAARKGRHPPTPEMVRVFRERLAEAKRTKPSQRAMEKTLGDLGEYFAAIVFGIKLHEDPIAQGSDGKIGREFVEVKTITPSKARDFVRLKDARNFSMVAVVKITNDFQFGARLIKRSSLNEPANGIIEIVWGEMIIGSGEYAMDAHRNFPFPPLRPKRSPNSVS